jgi:HD-like signal output (HDOD) protein
MKPDKPEIPSLEEVCTRALQLPCAPSLLPRLVLALQQDDSTAAEIEEIIALDSALATATLRLSNSAYYAGTEPVISLDHAILRLGQREIYRLAALVLVSRWEAVHKDNLRWAPGDYSRHSVCTALAAEVLAESSEKVDPSMAYTAGLVCDVGKLALAYVCAEFYPKVAAFCETGACTWEQAEKSVLGYNHAEVGARLLQGWRFPPIFIEVIEKQLTPEKASEASLPLIAHLHAARYLAVALGPGVTEDGFLFALHGPFLSQFGFTADFLEEAMIEVRIRAQSRLGEKINLGQLS